MLLHQSLDEKKDIGKMMLSLISRIVSSVASLAAPLYQQQIGAFKFINGLIKLFTDSFIRRLLLRRQAKIKVASYLFSSRCPNISTMPLKLFYL
jgi:hypothetical protein